nr:hypothetical protein [Tanacetum cinerariifolium]
DVSGFVGNYGGKLDSLGVIISPNGKKNNGPYGTQRGTHFSLPVKSGVISGFFGNHGGKLDSLGVIISPNN